MIQVTFTNGTTRKFKAGHMVHVAIDEAKNKWRCKKVQDLQAGDKVPYYDKPGPTSEVQTVEEV